MQLVGRMWRAELKSLSRYFLYTFNLSPETRTKDHLLVIWWTSHL